MSEKIKLTIVSAAVFSAALLSFEEVNVLMGVTTNNKSIASAVTVHYWVTDSDVGKREKGGKDETGRMQSNDRKNIL